MAVSDEFLEYVVEQLIYMEGQELKDYVEVKSTKRGSYEKSSLCYINILGSSQVAKLIPGKGNLPTKSLRITVIASKWHLHYHWLLPAPILGIYRLALGSYGATLVYKLCKCPDNTVVLAKHSGQVIL